MSSRKSDQVEIEKLAQEALLKLDKGKKKTGGEGKRVTPIPDKQPKAAIRPVNTPDHPQSKPVANPYGYKHHDPLNRPPSPYNPNVPACMAQKRTGAKGELCMRGCMVNAKGEYTRCKTHGGASPGAPRKSGQYSKLATRRILEVAEDLENDAGLTAIENNVKLLAAMFMEKMEALAADGVEELPDTELGKLVGLVERLSNLIERRHRIREGQKYTIKIEHLQYIIVAVADAVNRVLADQPELRAKLAKEIEGIRIIED